jgi:hypothetical protein
LIDRFHRTGICQAILLVEKESVMICNTWFRLLLATGVVVICTGRASAVNDLIGYFNFDDLSIATASVPGSGGVPTSISATTGTGTLSLTNWTGTVDDFTGTSVNSIPVNTPGDTSLTLIPGAGLAGNDDFIEFQFSMTGLSNFGVSYATQRTSTGFNSNQWSYSTDGTNFTNFASVINPNLSYSLTGPIITTALNNAATAYVRYTLAGATNAGGNNRIDNIQLLSNAIPAPPGNSATLPQPGDIVFGLNSGTAANTLELVRGDVEPSGGERFPGPWSIDTFIQSVEFDNSAGQSHNANGNLLGVNFAVGGGANSGAIYSFATQGSIPAPAGQLIGNTGATGPIGHAGNITQSNLAGLSVSPDNTKIAVVGEDSGSVIVYDYTAGNTMGAGASLANGRQTPDVASTQNIMVPGSTQGSAWLDNNTVLAFSSAGDLYEVDATTMATAYQTTVTTDAVLGTPFIGSNYSSIAYNPEVSDFVYALYSGFASGTSVTHLYVLDPTDGYAQEADIVLSGSSQTGREMALDADGNLFISAFDSTITYIPASAAQNPGTLTDNSSVFWYQSTSAATSFVGIDIGFGEAAADADYNNDGTVDAADYVAWRKSPASFGGDPAGYDAWKQQFGQPSPGAGGGGAVPEPASMTMLAIGLAALCFRRRSA